MLNRALRPLLRTAIVIGLGLTAGSCLLGSNDDDPPATPAPSGAIYFDLLELTGARRTMAVALDPATAELDTVPIPLATVSAPAVSPDGRQLAFSNAGDIILYDFATGRVRDITYISSSDRWPVWHPDGARVLILREQPGGVVFVLVNTDRSGERILFGETPYGMVFPSAAWSPDGRWVYFAAVALPDRSVLRRLDIATVGAVPEVVGPPDIAKVAISPATGTIAVLQERSGVDSVFVGVLDPATNDVRRVRGYSRANRITWSPDDRYLAVLHLPAGATTLAIDIVDAATGRIVRTIPNVTPDFGILPSWGPAPPVRAN